MVTSCFSFSVLVVRSVLPHCIPILTKTVMLQLLTICIAVAFDDLSQTWVFCCRLKCRVDIFALPYQILSGGHQLFLNNSSYEIIKYYLDFELPPNASIDVVLKTGKQIRCSGAVAPVPLSHHQQCCVNNALWVKSHVTFSLRKFFYGRQNTRAWEKEPARPARKHHPSQGLGSPGRNRSRWEPKTVQMKIIFQRERVFGSTRNGK